MVSLGKAYRYSVSIIPGGLAAGFAMKVAETSARVGGMK